MLIAGSALEGYTIEATDGRIGTVKTFLFDDTNWKIRWLVIDTGHWLTGRQVLIQPSAIGRPDHELQNLPVNLTKSQVEASPDIAQDQPVTLQMQSQLHSYYGWDPYWGPDYYGGGLAGMGMTGGFGMPYLGGERAREDKTIQLGSEDGDPHLRSMLCVAGYHIEADDGAIGHVENFLLDDATWTIRYLIVDTRNWWPGAHVLIAPFAVQSIDWDDKKIRLSVSREKVRASPPWDPAKEIDQMYERRLHGHYNWPGFGW
jgi:hypothetical protein